MQILCGISGIQFQCEHFPGYLNSRETVHPIFNVPQRKLITYARIWARGELTPTDSYLLFLATLNSTELVEFRVPAYRTEKTPAIVAANIESLFRIVIQMNTIHNPAVVFPRYVVSPDTKDLSTVSYWLDNWSTIYKDFQTGYRREQENREVLKKELVLERLIKNPHKPLSDWIRNLADWAAVAAEFPTFNTINRFTDKPTSCADYWKDIIIRCNNEIGVYGVNKQDLDKLLEHCETNLNIGTIYSNALLKLLRSAKHKQKNFLNISDGPIYSIINTPDQLEAAQISGAIDQAPDSPPIREQFPNKFEFLKAKMRYEMARKFKPQSGDSK